MILPRNQALNNMAKSSNENNYVDSLIAGETDSI